MKPRDNLSLKPFALLTRTELPRGRLALLWAYHAKVLIREIM